MRMCKKPLSWESIPKLRNWESLDPTYDPSILWMWAETESMWIFSNINKFHAGMKVFPQTWGSGDSIKAGKNTLKGKVLSYQSYLSYMLRLLVCLVLTFTYMHVYVCVYMCVCAHWIIPSPRILHILLKSDRKSYFCDTIWGQLTRFQHFYPNIMNHSLL